MVAVVLCAKAEAENRRAMVAAPSEVSGRSMVNSPGADVNRDDAPRRLYHLTRVDVRAHPGAGSVLRDHGGGPDPFGLEGHGHFLQRRLVDLGDAALVDAERVADLLHGHVVRVIEDDDLLIPRRQAVYG